MVRIEVRGRLQLARRRAFEPASSRAAAVQSGATSPKQPAQMPGLQLNASGAPARRRIPTAAARRQYRRDRCPPPQSLAVGARHRPEPSALPAGYDARHRATQTQSPNRKLQMQLLAQRWTHASLLRRGRKAERPLDMGSVHPGCSACGSRVCATSERGVAGNDDIRVKAEPLYVAIPNISMNVI